MRAIYRVLLSLEAILAGTLLLAMAGLIFAGGVARLMHHPINWTIDLSTCFFAWACFFCADIAWRRDSLMSLKALHDWLPGGARRGLDMANYLLIAAFLVYLIYSGVQLSWVSRARSFQGIPWISYSWVTMSLPVGSCLLLVTTILKFRRRLAGEEPAEASPESEPERASA